MIFHDIIICTVHCVIQLAICWGHNAWINALQDTGSIGYGTSYNERHRSRWLLHTRRHNGMLMYW